MLFSESKGKNHARDTPFKSHWYNVILFLKSNTAILHTQNYVLFYIYFMNTSLTACCLQRIAYRWDA